MGSRFGIRGREKRERGNGLILVALASAAILQAADGAYTARAAEKAYFTCLVEAARKVDDHFPDNNAAAEAVHTKAVAADIEAACQDQGWAYLVALKLARLDTSPPTVDKRAAAIISREAFKAIGVERSQPGNSDPLRHDRSGGHGQ